MNKKLEQNKQAKKVEVKKPTNQKKDIKKILKRTLIVIMIFLGIALGTFLAVLTGYITNGDEPAEGIPSLLLSWPVFIGSLISFGIIFLLCLYFFWKPMKNFVNAKYETEIKKIDKLNNDEMNAQKNLEESEKIIDRAKFDSREIISETKAEASALKRELLDEAKKQSEEFIAKNRELIEKERKELKKDLEKELFDTSILIAEKVIEKEINSKKNKDMIDDLIKELKK